MSRLEKRSKRPERLALLGRGDSRENVKEKATPSRRRRRPKKFEQRVDLFEEEERRGRKRQLQKTQTQKPFSLLSACEGIALFEAMFFSLSVCLSLSFTAAGAEEAKANNFFTRRSATRRRACTPAPAAEACPSSTPRPPPLPPPSRSPRSGTRASRARPRRRGRAGRLACP